MSRAARTADQFWDFVSKDVSEHWLWTGSRHATTGHGVWMQGGATVQAHRHALELDIGRPLEDHEYACHVRECPHPHCVRPSHLYVGNAATNAKDRFAVLAAKRGESSAQVVRLVFRGYDFDPLPEAGSAPFYRLRAWFTWTGISRNKLAARIGCSQPMLSYLLNGRKCPGLRLAFAIERESASWPDGPLRAAEWLEAVDNNHPC